MDFFSERKSAQKHNWRGLKSETPESTEELLDSALEGMSNIESPITFPPQRSSGWEDESSKITKNTDPDNRFYNETVIDFNQDNDIPVIPDIDEIQDDILRPTEIKQPTILVDTSTYKELAKELTEENAPSEFFYLTKSDDIDLSLLTDSLCLEEDVKEADVEWTLDSLLNDFVSVTTSTTE